MRRDVGLSGRFSLLSVEALLVEFRCQMPVQRPLIREHFIAWVAAELFGVYPTHSAFLIGSRVGMWLRLWDASDAVLMAGRGVMLCECTVGGECHLTGTAPEPMAFHGLASDCLSYFQDPPRILVGPGLLGLDDPLLIKLFICLSLRCTMALASYISIFFEPDLTHRDIELKFFSSELQAATNSLI